MLLDRFVEKLDFESYEDFRDNFKIKIPENFNFSYDVVDVLADEQSDLKAVVWTNDNGEHREFTFSDLKKYSDMTASFFQSQGIKRGDAVMLILKRRYEFWFSILALHKIGAICIPATHMLTKDDIIYRNNAASVKMIVSVNDESVLTHIERAMDESRDC